jgi:hypothetical protein
VIPQPAGETAAGRLKCTPLMLLERESSHSTPTRSAMAHKWFSQIQKVEYDSWVYAPTPTKKTLREFETANNFQLPASFCEFAQYFGSGELMGHFRFVTPLDLTKNEAKKVWDLGVFNEESHGRQLLTGRSPTLAAERLVFFGSTIGGLSYAWDLADVRDAASHEYAIYEIRLDVKLVADSFRSFILDYCLGKYWEGDDEVKIGWEFIRYGVKKKRNR